MFQDGSIALFHYWNKLRGSRPAPRRTEIEPAQIKTLLADTFILERDGYGEPLFRLAGTRICATYGKELRGHFFLSLWSAKDQAVAGRAVRESLDAGAVTVITFEGESLDGRLNSFELLILPLDSAMEGARALGTIQPFMKPFWLGTDPIVENRVGSLRLIEPDRESLSPASHQAMPAQTPLADGEMFAAHHNDHGRRIRHLVVLQGGRRQ